jgi:hypothetical protein
MFNGWFFNNITYGSWQINGLQVVNNPNLLRQWQNIIPFGIMCSSPNNRDPQLQTDFTSGNNQVFLLSQEECEYVNQMIEGVPIWNLGTYYYINQLVQYQGSYYACLINNSNQNPATATTYWELYS